MLLTKHRRGPVPEKVSFALVFVDEDLKGEKLRQEMKRIIRKCLIPLKKGWDKPSEGFMREYNEEVWDLIEEVIAES